LESTIETPIIANKRNEPNERWDVN